MTYPDTPVPSSATVSSLPNGKVLLCLRLLLMAEMCTLCGALTGDMQNSGCIRLAAMPRPPVAASLAMLSVAETPAAESC